MYSIKQEATRCLKCKKPQCSAHCPVSTDIPRVMELFLNGGIREAGELLFMNNPLSAVTSVICPHEKNCTGHCVLGKKGEPIHFYNVESYISRFYLETTDVPEIEKNGIKIAVAGSGPAGITMSILLLLNGYDVTMFEAQDNIETEPNNIRESANRIQPGQTVSGSMGNTKDTDWFTFDLDVPALVQPVLTFSPMESNTKAFALTVYHGNTVVQKIDYKGKEYSKVVMPVSLDPGNYMIELSNAGGVIKDYTLKLAYQSVDHAEGEPNNDMSTAKQMPIGEVITGTFTGSSDTDWYAFHCDAAGIYHLNIQMEGVNDSKTVCAMQISSGGGETQSISIKGSGFDQNIKISQAGTYYIKLSPKSDISCVYTIAINQAAE